MTATSYYERRRAELMGERDALAEQLKAGGAEHPRLRRRYLRAVASLRDLELAQKRMAPPWPGLAPRGEPDAHEPGCECQVCTGAIYCDGGMSR